MSEEKRKLSKKEIQIILGSIKPRINTEASIQCAENNKAILRRDLPQIELYPSDIKRFAKDIFRGYNKALAEAGEMVGFVAACSIGEPTTQQTLNSVDWTEKIILRQGQNITIDTIGNIIDNCIKKNKNIKRLENDMIYVDINDENYSTLSVDGDGKMGWYKVEAFTRHLPMNKDGSNTLLKVKTKLNREIIATKAKSFLVRKDNKIIGINGSDLKIGDRLPITINFPVSEEDKLLYIELEKFLPKTQYLYGSELFRALEIKKQYKSEGKSFWWSKNNGKEFVVPYKRSDTAMDCFKKKHIIKKGLVYSKNHGGVTAEIPEKIPLDNDFGFFIGAYLAEGCTTKHQVIISNNDGDYRRRITDFCDRYKLGYHIQLQNDKNGIGWTSTDIHIHVSMLVVLMKKWCGTLAHGKHIPTWAILANDDFLKGVIDGYFSGDGTISKRDGIISATSVSLDLLHGMSLILNRFDILSNIYPLAMKTSNNLNSKVFHRAYHLQVRNGNANKFARLFVSVINYKQELLCQIKDRNFLYKYSKFDIIPSVSTQNFKGNYHRDKLLKYAEEVDLKDEELDILNKTIDSDVIFSEIVSIEEVESSHKYVYDLTVEKTRTFMLFSGLNSFDTFHLAGKANKTMILGVPRLQECMDATKKPKTPSCLIFVNDDILNKHVTEITDMNKKEILEKNDKTKDKIKSEKKETKIMCLNRLEKYRKYISFMTIKGFLKKKPVLKYKLSTPFKHPLNLLLYDKYKEPWWVKVSNQILGTPQIEKKSWIVELTFNMDELFKYDITLSEIARIIDTTESFKMNSGSKKKKIRCNFSTTYSPLNEGVIEVYIDFDLVMEVVMPKLDLNGDKEDEEDGYKLITEDNIEYFYARDICLQKILEIQVCGVNGITNIFPNENNGKWAIDTQGANFLEILRLSFVDYAKTVCDDFWQVYYTLGIEAAREVVREQLSNSLSFEATYINPRHIELLADSMTVTGIITSVRREGIKRSVGPISKSAFEKTLENFAIAAMFTEQENVKSVSASITMGRMANIGTHISKICLPNKENPIKTKEQRKVFDVLNLNKMSGKARTDLVDKFYSLLEKVKFNHPLKIINISDMETSYYITIDCGESIPEKNINTYLNLLKKQVDVERATISQTNKRKNTIIVEVIKKFDVESDDESSSSNEEEVKEEKIELIDTEIVSESEEDIEDDLEDDYDDD